MHVVPTTYNQVESRIRKENFWITEKLRNVYTRK